MMEIKLQKIPIREALADYKDSANEGVTAYAGKLDIRPEYQREYIYDDKQRNAVIKSIRKKFPLNVMYWVENNFGKFEVLDGQQRMISIGKYVNNEFSVDYIYFKNLKPEEQNQILDFVLMVYFCKGTPRERLEWFEIINIPGLKLEPQEVRNATFSGPWLTDAKKYFSKPGCVAYQIASAYIQGKVIRQAYLEIAIKWISSGKIEDYMGNHQTDTNATDLWLYFQSVIEWIEITFIEKRSEMKRVPFGLLYRKHKHEKLDSKELETEIKKLMEDYDVKNKAGIYRFVLTRDESYLQIRTFNNKQKREAYERQNKICLVCSKHFKFEEMEGDHIISWANRGKTIAENCQMLCKSCNRKKSGK